MYKNNKKIKTRDFDEISVNDNDVIRFVGGMYGFEQYTEYVILKDNPEDDIMFLQSLTNADLSFVLIDPYSIIQEYTPYLNEDDLDELQVKSEADLKYLVIAIIKENIKDSVVNLKSPVVLNPITREAKQVILQNDYPLRYNFIVDEGDAKC